jgi:hypothetical protein
LSICDQPPTPDARADHGVIADYGGIDGERAETMTDLLLMVLVLGVLAIALAVDLGAAIAWLRGGRQ